MFMNQGQEAGRPGNQQTPDCPGSAPAIRRCLLIEKFVPPIARGRRPASLFGWRSVRRGPDFSEGAAEAVGQDTAVATGVVGEVSVERAQASGQLQCR